MSLFKQLEGQVAVIVENGVYRVADLYVRGGYLYAKNGSGFVRLYDDGATTKTSCRIDTIHLDGALRRDTFGRLCDGSVKNSAPLGVNKERMLIGAGSNG